MQKKEKVEALKRELQQLQEQLVTVRDHTQKIEDAGRHLAKSIMMLAKPLADLPPDLD